MHLSRTAVAPKGKLAGRHVWSQVGKMQGRQQDAVGLEKQDTKAKKIDIV